MPGIMVAKAVKAFIPMNKFLMIAMTVLALGCKKSSQSNSSGADFFPPVQVNTQINMSFPQYASLQNLQGYVYLTGVGNKGIVVYHTTDDQFVAFDRTCSVNPTQSCAIVSVDSIPTRYRCGKPGTAGWEKCCNSTFDATYGTALSGEARQGLKQYYTARSGSLVYISSSPL